MQANTHEDQDNDNKLFKSIEERKRSISARGENRRNQANELINIQNQIMTSFQIQPEILGRNHIPNIAWQSSGNANHNDEEEIDELINDFSNEIERN